jgi:hypothetical protein
VRRKVRELGLSEVVIKALLVICDLDECIIANALTDADYYLSVGFSEAGPETATGCRKTAEEVPHSAIVDPMASTPSPDR